jgi:hypothetical protein
MKELFIPYQEALEMKQLGFDEPCFGKYDGSGKHKGKLWYEMPNKGKDYIPVKDVLAPLYSQAFKWFRSKYDIACYVETKSLTTGGNTYDYTILVTKGDEWDDGKRWKTYEEAELACLRKLIELVKQQS